MIFENDLSIKAGKEDFKKGYIEIWLKETDKQAHTKLISIRDTSENFEQAFLAMLYSFNPGLPYRFAGNIFIKNPYDLLAEINKDGNKWLAGKTELYNGAIITWLQNTGNYEIVKKWNTLKNNVTSQDIGLEGFLHIVNEKTIYPKLTTFLNSIDYPKIQSGKIIQTTINFNLENRGYTEANISFLKELPGVTLSEKKLIFNSAAGQVTQSSILYIDSSLLLKGVDYKTALHINTSANQKIEIPVMFKIVFPKNAFILEILKYAAIVAVMFCLVRFIISSAHPNWLHQYFDYFISADEAFTYYPSFATFGWAFFLFITCFVAGIYFLIKYLSKR